MLIPYPQQYLDTARELIRLRGIQNKNNAVLNDLLINREYFELIGVDTTNNLRETARIIKKIDATAKKLHAAQLAFDATKEGLFAAMREKIAELGFSIGMRIREYDPNNPHAQPTLWEAYYRGYHCQKDGVVIYLSFSNVDSPTTDKTDFTLSEICDKMWTGQIAGV